MWFPEPSEIDGTWKEREEHSLDWLARSTLSRAKEMRRFLNEHLAALPEENQSKIYKDLRHRWRSAFFEIIVVRTMQLLGASVLMETETQSGSRPDITACFEDVEIVIEATSPTFNSELGEDAKLRTPLLDIIEAHAPEGWSIAVETLPEIGPSDSKKEFRREVKKKLTLPPPSPEAKEQIISVTVSQGEVVLKLFPKRYADDRAIIIEPGYAYFDDTESRVRRKVKSKRKQVRDVEASVLLAIDGKGLSSDPEAFDRALFGSSAEVLNENRQTERTFFDANGAFMSGEGEPTYAGVLAFFELGFGDGCDPILFLHPRFKGKLPQELLQLEQHTYVGDSGVQVEPSQNSGFLKQLNFVRV